MAIRVVKKGILTADGTEQTLVELTELTKLEGYVDLSNLGSGDTIVIRQYQKINGTYRQYAEESYSGAQSLPAIYITPKSGEDGIKVTLQQTVGTLRAFPYCFFKETEAKKAFNV
jgi:hypothetical protein